MSRRQAKPRSGHSSKLPAAADPGRGLPSPKPTAVSAVSRALQPSDRSHDDYWRRPMDQLTKGEEARRFCGRGLPAIITAEALAHMLRQDSEFAARYFVELLETMDPRDPVPSSRSTGVSRNRMLLMPTRRTTALP